jgi:hypothetical protein
MKKKAFAENFSCLSHWEGRNLPRRGAGSKIKKIEIIFATNFARNYEKRMILGTSDAWSTSHLSQQTSKPAYYIVDCRILKLLILEIKTFGLGSIIRDVYS